MGVRAQTKRNAKPLRPSRVNKARLSRFDRERLARLAVAFETFYRSRGRKFPWRNERDGYRLALAEVLLTKTRADSVFSLYEKLLSLYPSPKKLSEANISELELLLRPLGLSRKRSHQLQQFGMALVDQGMKVLESSKTATVLPGIGIYAAAAIGCFYSGERVGIVDANVHRVLTRVFGLRANSMNRLFALAAQLAIEARDPKWTNYGLLDLGAIVCRPTPRCHICPLTPDCHWVNRC